jgi:hypothetical protein
MQIEQARLDVLRADRTAGIGLENETIFVIPDQEIDSTARYHNTVEGEGNADLTLVVDAPLGECKPQGPLIVGFPTVKSKLPLDFDACPPHFPRQRLKDPAPDTRMLPHILAPS